MGSKTPLDAYFRVKEAALPRLPPGLGKRLGEGAMQAGVAAGGAALVAGGAFAAEKAYDALTQGRDFRGMLAENPDIAEAHQENPKAVNRMYATLRTFNPAFSRDPLVAGSYVRQMLEDPLHAGGKVVDALNYRDKANGPGYGQAVFRSALSGMAGSSKGG